MLRKLKILSGAIALLIATSVAAQQPPNIVLFLVDDMGWQDTSVPFHTERTALNDRYRTPNMERLADDGMIVTQAYACSVCSPSLVSLKLQVKFKQRCLLQRRLLKVLVLLHFLQFNLNRHNSYNGWL